MVRLVGLESKGSAYTLKVAADDDGVGRKGPSSSPSTPPPRKFAFIGWSRNHTELKRWAGPADSGGPFAATGGRGDWRTASRGGASDASTVADLPRELVFLDMETAMPKISPLPPGGGIG